MGCSGGPGRQPAATYTRTLHPPHAPRWPRNAQRSTAAPARRRTDLQHGWIKRFSKPDHPRSQQPARCVTRQLLEGQVCSRGSVAVGSAAARQRRCQRLATVLPARTRLAGASPSDAYIPDASCESSRGKGIRRGVRAGSSTCRRGPGQTASCLAGIDQLDAAAVFLTMQLDHVIAAGLLVQPVDVLCYKGEAGMACCEAALQCCDCVVGTVGAARRRHLPPPAVELPASV